jgi:hypothetical protein
VALFASIIGDYGFTALISNSRDLPLARLWWGGRTTRYKVSGIHNDVSIGEFLNSEFYSAFHIYFLALQKYEKETI